MRRLLFVFIMCIMSVAAVSQAIWVVNTTDDADDGSCNAAHCSLREAIRSANNNVGPDSIAFNIPGPGTHTIMINTPLPGILDSFLVIEGTSQPNNFPMNGLIVIDGSNLGGIADHGLVIYTRHTQIYGLQIQNFPGDGIQIFGGFADDPFISDLIIGAPDKGNVLIDNAGYGIEGPIDSRVTVQDNYVGTDLSFTAGQGNGWDGMFFEVLSGDEVLIGGKPSDNESNFLCSNNFSGLRIRLSDPAVLSKDLRIVGNRIGTDVTSSLDLGNTGNIFGGGMAGGGIVIDGDGPIRIGGGADSTNIIAYNYDGIYIASSNQKTCYQNFWKCNSNAGIRLAPGTNDDIQPPNSLCIGMTSVDGVAAPNVRVDIFSHVDAGCSGAPCQGIVKLGNVTSDASGFWSLPGAISPDIVITAIATDPQGNTSEFSSCSDRLDIVATNNGPVCQFDSIFLMTIINGTAVNPTFEWTGPLGYFSTEQNPTDATEPGEYRVIVNYENCLPDTATTIVEVLPVTFETITTLCAGQEYLINGTVYDMDNPMGQEILEDANAFGCDSVVIIDLQGQITPLVRFESPDYACLGDTIEHVLFIDNGPDGPWDLVYTDGVNPPDTLLDVFEGLTFTEVATGNILYEVLDLTADFTPCAPIIETPDSTLVSDIKVSGSISEYDGFNVSCGGGNDGFIELTVTDFVGNLMYIWSTGDLTDSIETGLRAGPYSVTVIDDAGCRAVFDTVLTEPAGLQPAIDVMRPSCNGAMDGGFIVDTVTGVMGALEWSVDSMNWLSLTDFPLEFNELGFGQQFIYFRDEGDCVLGQEIFIPEGDVPFIDLGPKLSITGGDSVQLMLETDMFEPTIQWSPATTIACPSCPVTSAAPEVTQYFIATLTNAEGCFAQDSVLVEVFAPKRVYIPNVFSPNGDNINDYFFVHANSFATDMSMEVFERGGNVVYSKSSIPVSSAMDGWDGTFRGQEVNPGVYAYLIKVRFTDGKEIPYSGTVTLIR